MRLLLIGCGLLVRELSDAIVHSPHVVDARFLPAGLHDSGAKTMRQRIQQEVDAADATSYEISTESKGSNKVVFSIKNTAGTVSRTCLPVGKGGCPTSGTW